MTDERLTEIRVMAMKWGPFASVMLECVTEIDRLRTELAETKLDLSAARQCGEDWRLSLQQERGRNSLSDKT
jgi:hypothetical protein